MIKMLDKNEILNRYKRGEAIRSIAKNMGISRNTVRVYTREYEAYMKELDAATTEEKISFIQNEMTRNPKSKPHTISKRKFNAEVKQRFLEIIKTAEEKDKVLGINKQRLTATLIHKVLIMEGYDIGETSIRNYYNEYKKKQKECFIRQEYEYGERAEYDFHQIKVIIDGKPMTYHQVTISMPSSNHVFGLLYKDETKTTVMDSIIKFINYSNGVFKEMVFDNMSTVVKRFILKGEKEYTDEIISLSNYYGFKIVTCNPRSSNEKGHVENSGKVTRNTIFILKYKFDTEDDLFVYYKKALEKFNEKSFDKWNIEKQHLLSKPKYDYVVYRCVECSVDSYSTITIENNYYSVPDRYVGYKLTAHVLSDSIIVYNNNIELAKHKKKKGFKEYSIDINHYINTFLMKPGALNHSVALKQAPEALRKAFYEDYNMDARKFLEAVFLGQINNKDKTYSIEEISTNQLDKISNIFGQGENNEQRVRVCKQTASSVY